MQVWMRLGGMVTGDSNEIAKVKAGDTEMLIELIKRNGFWVDGNTYIPDAEGNDTEFDLNAINLVEDK